MSQWHLQNMFHESVDVIWMIKNVTRDKNETMINVSVSIKQQQDIARVKKTMLEIVLRVLASLICIVTLNACRVLLMLV